MFSTLRKEIAIFHLGIDPDDLTYVDFAGQIAEISIANWCDEKGYDTNEYVSNHKNYVFCLVKEQGEEYIMAPTKKDLLRSLPVCIARAYGRVNKLTNGMVEEVSYPAQFDRIINTIKRELDKTPANDMKKGDVWFCALNMTEAHGYSVGEMLTRRMTIEA